MNARPNAVQLPPPILRFFSDDTTEPRVLAEFVAEDAVVADEGQQYVGPAAIGRWRADAVAKYRVTNEPLSAETAGSETKVIVRVSGTFPNSPIQLQFRFTVAGGRISRLEIAS